MTQNVTATTSATREQQLRKFISAPTLLILIIITQIPFAFTLYYSFQNWNLLRPGNINWIGVRNYVRAFENPDFLRILWNTLVLSVSVVVITFVVGMIFALLLNRPFLGRGIARTLLISPFLVMPVVTAVLWKNVLLNPAFGMATYFLSLFGLPPIDWLAHYAMPSVIVTIAWQWTPFVMLILLAGLQSLPESTLEAASLDGANGLSLFRYIILPHLRTFIEIALLMEVLFILNIFGEIFVMTSGGPGIDTTNLPFEIYKEAFLRWNVSRAAAFGVLAVVLANIVVLLFLRVLRSEDQSQSAA
ncbi:MAG: sugar ABC transporter permease [Caldilineaceae bacterium]|nr:sugar ABC transporter permease [Caldilineaceae bacterium]MCB0143263.1 sugar ABC transporter permease [Caldilineaceae bacterium]